METDRMFRDMNGIEWQVAQIKAAPADDGFLSFTTGSMQRRLTPAPSEWRNAPVHRLEQMCRIATPVERMERIEHTPASTFANASAETAAASVADDAVELEVSDSVTNVGRLHDHVSVLANVWPAEQRVTFRG